MLGKSIWSIFNSIKHNPHMIYHITGNKHKAESANKRLKPFNIQLKQKTLHLIEPQEEDITTVAESKAQQANRQIKRPVLVSDSGISIPALNGFPGPFMHYITKWLTASDLLNLMQNKTDRTIYFQNVAVYQDSQQQRAFKSERKGLILSKAEGKGIPLDQIVTFRKDYKTIAECENFGLSRFDSELKDSIWFQFGEWYNKFNKLIKN
ncbi:hypothetical protein GF357_03260 [Candidatus Dojkabacteria bacterium]|nr:hypothetical protein [Candidatus Dojkabacteria bacterium]